MEYNRILQGDVLQVLRALPAGCVNMVVTSPPYYGLRDYGTANWTGGDPECDHAGPPLRTKENINRNTGTGDDAEVALRTGRRYLGIELNPDYIKLANQRLAPFTHLLNPLF